MTATTASAAQPQVAEEALSIVVRGSFNPRMFLPSLFRDAELLGEIELAATEIEAITPEWTSLRLGWAKIDVTQDTFQLRTEQVEEYSRLRDLAVGTLRILDHHSIGALGVNQEMHALVDSSEQLHALGDKLTPKATWESFLTLPGMRSISMWGLRGDHWKGRIQINVEPSLRFSPAFFVAVNDHFELDHVEQQPTGRDGAFGEGSVEPTPEKRQRAIDVLLEEWDRICGRAQDAYEKITAIAIEGMQ